MKLVKTLLLFVLVASGSSSAETYKHITESLSSAQFERLRLELTVGELEIEVWSGDTIELDIELRGERSWLMWRRRNIEDIEVEIRENGNELYVGIEERNLEQEWHLKVPENLALEIEMGVGDVNIRGLVGSLALELGVGAVSITTLAQDFEIIEASVGVGDVSLHGFKQGTENGRSFVSADANYHGSGTSQVLVELGVGDVSIRKQ